MRGKIVNAFSLDFKHIYENGEHYKKIRNLNVLIHFYKEKWFSILKLKDCLPKDCEGVTIEKFKIQD